LLAGINAASIGSTAKFGGGGLVRVELAISVGFVAN
jgi:hypothetical protein